MCLYTVCNHYMSNHHPVASFLIAVFIFVNSVRENKKNLSLNLSSKSAAEELQTRPELLVTIGLDVPSSAIDSSYRGTLSKYPKSMLSSVNYVIRPDVMKCICHLRPMGIRPRSDLLLSFEYSWGKGRNIDGRRQGNLKAQWIRSANMNFFKRCTSSGEMFKIYEGKGGRIFNLWGLTLYARGRNEKKKGPAILDKFTFFRRIVLFSHHFCLRRFASYQA